VARVVQAVLEQELLVQAVLVQADPVPGHLQAVRRVLVLPAQVLVVRVQVLPAQARRVRVARVGLRAAGVLAGLPAVEPWEMVARRSLRPSPG
jgi:hypothetical protein